MKKVVTIISILLLVLMSCSFTDEKEGGDTAAVEMGETRLYDFNPDARDVVDIGSRFAGGNGTEDDPYLISNVSQLQDMNLDLGANYTLVNDIDASETREWNDGRGFAPVSEYNWGEENLFIGSFDGKGCHITGLYINRSSGFSNGLFGYVKNHGYISNIALIDNEIKGNENVGGIVGLNRGTVENCSVTGKITGEVDIGGLLGANCGIVRNCSAMGKITGNEHVGGLVGNNFKTLENSYATVIVNGKENVGGLVGLNTDKIHNCSVTGNVSGNEQVGGLLGKNLATVQNCFASGNVTGDWDVGGLVGLNDIFLHDIIANEYGTITNCYATTHVMGDWNIGGLVGSNNCYINNSFYSINTTTVNRKNVITPYGIYQNQFDQWLDNSKKLNIDTYLSKTTGSDYYNIANTMDIQNLLPFAADGEYKFRQTGDIDMSDEPNFYIGLLNAGEFDGAGYKISKLNVTINNISKIGFFGCIESESTIVNVTLVDNNIKGSVMVGGLVGINYGGLVKNCLTTGIVTGVSFTGGLVGWNEGVVQNCHATSKVTGDDCIGGVVGRNYDTVQNCYATGNVNGNNRVGGLVGRNKEGIVDNCYATGTVSGGGFSIGGLVGENDAIVSSCYAMGAVSGDIFFGGLVGENRGSVVNCYSTGNGGDEWDFGGLVSFNEGTVNSSFWDMETSKESNSDGGTGRTTIEMMTKRTFIEAGWDFETIWYIRESVDYPRLQWEMELEMYTHDSDNDSIPDIMDAFPFDPAASIDSDGDGMPDEWNPGMDREDSTSDPPLEMDPFPNDPKNAIDDGSNSWILIGLGTSLLIIILLLIVLIIAKKIIGKRGKSR